MKDKLIRKTVDNNGVEIEYYVTNQVNDQATLIISMGVWEPAIRAFPLISRLSGRHCIVISYRGRGGSSTPISGFDWQDHSSDLSAVLQKEQANKPVFLGFSKGVSYMLGYLSTNPDQPKGIIIIDYPALHLKAPKGYSEVWKNLEYNGYGLLNYITAPTLDGIEKESSYKEFYSDLSKIKCPIWLFRGTDSESDIPSNLTEEDITQYKSYINNLDVIDFKHSGHMILDEELGKATKNIRIILHSIDAIH